MSRISWDTNKILDYVAEFIRNNDDISPKALRNSHPSLRKAVKREYGGWDGLYEALGINPDDARIRTFWSPEMITDKIKEYYNSGTPVNSVNMKVVDASLYNAGRRCFGDWKTSVEAAGIDYIEIIDHTLITGCGILFEQIVKEILEALGHSLIYNRNIAKGCRPDFVLDDGTIIDAKLSSWSVFANSCKTIEKYTDHTDKLIIVFLRGKEVKMTSTHLEIINVNRFYPELVEHGRSDLINRCQELLNEVNVMSSLADF